MKQAEVEDKVEVERRTVLFSQPQPKP